MTAKRKPKPDERQKVTMEDWNSLLKNVLATSVLLQQSGGKLDLANEQQWDLWRVCRQIAGQPENQLAKILSAPAFATIPIIEGLVSKTEIALQSKGLSEEQIRQLKTLSDQLDFSLALFYRQLGHLISWRGRQTRNSDLFCEALSIANGDSAKQARLIRRCVDDFPESISVGSDNIVDSFAWETYRRVELLDHLADEFPDQIVTAAEQMHGWPMLRQRHHDNRARFEALAERFNLGSGYPLDTSKRARFRPDTPMVRLLDPLVCQLHHINRVTQNKRYSSIEEETKSLRNYWWETSDDPFTEEVLAILRDIRELPLLSKSTVSDWAKKGIVPIILATDARDYLKCRESALRAIANQKGVKSIATFKSRLLAAVIPTLKSMARPD